MNLAQHRALDDFREARRQAALQQVLSRLTGRSEQLLSFDEVQQALSPTGQSEGGIQEVPVAAIVGSVGRYNDFTRSFLPRQESDDRRWAAMMAIAVERGLDALPPIEVFKVGEAYFVSDGNHRVSVTRRLGLEYIRARVIEVHTRVPLSPEANADDLIVMAEQTKFLERTRLDETRPGADLRATAAGRYEQLEREIAAQQQAMQSAAGRVVSFEEAAGRWFDDLYRPVAQAIWDRGLLRDFPGRTVTDLYLWIEEHRDELRERFGEALGPADMVAGFAAAHAADSDDSLRRAGQRLLDTVLPDDLGPGPRLGRWREDRLAARYADRLFQTILVPVSGQPDSWKALEQSLTLARLEGARLLGLHVAAEGAPAAEVSAEFERRCREAGVTAASAVERSGGPVARAISERAALADLVVLHLAHPPEPFRLGSGFRAVIQRSPQPVLAVPEVRSPLRQALLAYDDSPKAREALFVAAYLAETHGLALAVLAAGPDGAEPVDYVRRYLELHDITAQFVTREGRAGEVIAQAAEDLDADLVLMGGYGAHPALGVVLGSTVDYVLRHSRRPVLICR